MPCRTLACIFALYASLTANTLATTWLVDQAGGGHFTDLPQALAAAQPGDVLLVNGGIYTAPAIDKAISIYGMVDGLPADIHGVTTIRGIGADALVHLRDLEFRFPYQASSGWVLTLEQCAGVVLLERCLVRYKTSFCTSAGVDIENSNAVAWIDLAATMHAFTAAGAAGSMVRVPLPIPDEPALEGLFLAFQGLDLQGYMSAVAAATLVP